MRTIERYLDDIILSCDTIATYIGDISSEAIFTENDMVRQAVRARLMDIGGPHRGYQKNSAMISPRLNGET